MTEPGLDHLRVFAIDPAGSAAPAPLVEVNVADPPVVFEGDTDIAAYGIAGWKAPDGGAYVVMSQRLVGGPGRTPDGDEFVCEIDESSPTGQRYLTPRGLTIYRLAGARGYLLASSQGRSTFLVYDLTSLKLLRTFEIGGGPTDHVDESDGAMVVNVSLGDTVENGLLVTHDGNNEPNDEATNFKFTRWEDVAGARGLKVGTAHGDPRG